MFNHIILFDFSKNVKDNNKEKEAFESLKASVLTLLKIDEVVDAQIYLNESSSSDLVFLVKFKDIDSLKQYQSNPIHMEHANRMKDLVERLNVIDFISEA